MISPAGAFTPVSYKNSPVEEAATHCFSQGQERNGSKVIDIAIPLKVDGRKFPFRAEDALLALPPIITSEAGLRAAYQLRFSGNKKLARKLLKIEADELRMNTEGLNGKEMTISPEKSQTSGFFDDRFFLFSLDKWRRKYLPQNLSFRVACFNPTSPGRSEPIDEIRVNLRLEPVELCDIADLDVLETVGH